MFTCFKWSLFLLPKGDLSNQIWLYSFTFLIFVMILCYGSFTSIVCPTCFSCHHFEIKQITLVWSYFSIKLWQINRKIFTDYKSDFHNVPYRRFFEHKLYTVLIWAMKSKSKDLHEKIKISWFEYLMILIYANYFCRF